MQTCLDPLFCLPGPSWLAHHLAHPSAHLRTPLCTSAHLCAPLRTLLHTSAHPCATFALHFPGLVTLIGPSILTSDPFGYLGQLSPSATGVGRITVPSINSLWSPVWRLSACLESGIIYDIPFNMQNLSKILLKLKLGNSKVLQITS